MEFEIAFLAVLLDDVDPFVLLDEFVQGDDVWVAESCHH
jgi:hypothetical protein